MVLQIERSARGKVHLDVRMPIGMTIQQTQLAFIEALGVDVKPDTSCFSPERIIFISGIAEEIFRSPQWYALLPEDEVAERFKAVEVPWNVDKSLGFRVKGLESHAEGVTGPAEGVPSPSLSQGERDGTAEPNSQSSILEQTERNQASLNCRGAAENHSEAVILNPQLTNNSKLSTLNSKLNSSKLTFKGMPYAAIIAEWWKLQVGEPAEGERNVKLYQLAVNLRAICDNNKEVLLQILPRLGLEEQEVLSIVDSACKEPPKGISKLLKGIIEHLTLNIEQYPADGNTAEPNSQSSILNAQSTKGLDGLNAYLSAETPPPMPTPLPPFIEVICSHVPEEYKPAVAMSSFVAMGCHPEGLWWNYIDQRRHEPAFMHTVVATQSVGKSCVNKPLEYLMEDIRLADEVNRQREAEWKQNRSSKGANKEKPKRPEGLRIQITEPDMTNAALVQRLDDVGEKFLFTNMDELELLNNLRSGARGNQVSQLIRLAFDQGFYGQERVGADSVTARVQVRWNWNAGCTVAKAQRFFRGAVTDGTLSRISFSTIIEDPSGRMPMFKPYDDSYAEALKPFIDRLNEATGEVRCEEADALAWRLNEGNQQIVTTSFDEVFKILCRRANVLAHQRAMMLWLAHGRAWSKEIEDFVVWSEKYDLWCKMHFFGQMMEDEMKQEYLVPRRGPRNFLTTLDRKTFDMKYLQAKVRERSLSTSASLLVSQWKYRKLISVDESGMITVLI
ncbi:MAG: hypothetical protein Q4D30_10540 [Bacteroidales bacterium]|nr:hypothetical protein [Bacteroidales bacterium]